MQTTLENRVKYFSHLKQSRKVAYFNLFVFIFLFVIELLIALSSHSKALLAASFNNLSSVIISLGIIIGLRTALKDPSYSHRKGYHQFETLGNLFSSFVMFLMSAYIVFEGSKGVISSLNQASTQQDVLPVLIAFLAGGIMLVVYLINQKYYKKIESNSINTLMKDALSDTVMNLGTGLGILVAIKISPVFDCLTATILGGLLCYMAFQVIKDNIFHLSGGFNPQMIQNYYHVIEMIPGVEGIVDITGQMFGDAIAVDVTIEVSREISVWEGSLIAETIEEELTSRFDIFDVDVQVKPKRTVKN